VELPWLLGPLLLERTVRPVGTPLVGIRASRLPSPREPRSVGEIIMAKSFAPVVPVSRMVFSSVPV